MRREKGNGRMRRDRGEKKIIGSLNTVPLGPQLVERPSFALPCDGTGHPWVDGLQLLCPLVDSKGSYSFGRLAVSPVPSLCLLLPIMEDDSRPWPLVNSVFLPGFSTNVAKFKFREEGSCNRQTVNVKHNHKINRNNKTKWAAVVFPRPGPLSPFNGDR